MPLPVPPTSPDESTGRPDPFSSVRWANLFPGRNRISVREAAKAVELSVPHVINLIEGGIIDAETAPGGKTVPKTERYHITEAAWEAFIEGRRTK